MVSSMPRLEAADYSSRERPIMEEYWDSSAMMETCATIGFSPPEQRPTRSLPALTGEQREGIWIDPSGTSEAKCYLGKGSYCSLGPSTTPPPATTAVARAIKVGSDYSEDPAAIGQALWNLKQMLCTRVPLATPLGQALQRSKEYVMADRFLLKFLRAERLDTEAALALLLSHFEIKFELFGGEKLTRDIRMSDLNPGALDALYVGAFQFLPSTDFAGRYISFCRPIKFRGIGTTLDVGRAYFYYHMILSEDDQAQRLGVVRIVSLFDHHQKDRYDQELVKVLSRVVFSVPLRYEAAYVVTNSGFWSTTLDLALLIQMQLVKLQARVIAGTRQEVLYSLYCSGIPIRHLPISPTGDVLVKAFRARINELRAREELPAGAA